MSSIKITGAKTHNLKNIDVDIPRDKLVVITGLSGSGKSSLAFDTLYAEGQRRYVESLSSYARQFLSMMDKPEVDHIEGLSPAIAIEQKTVSHNPRSTVGTITEIYDYLRLLFARVGVPTCPSHKQKLTAQTIDEMVDRAMTLPPESKIMLLAPYVEDRKGEYQQWFDTVKREGFLRVMLNNEVISLAKPIEFDSKKKNTISLVIDRLVIRPGVEQRLAESFEVAIRNGNGMAEIAWMDEPSKPKIKFSAKHACSECGFSAPQLEPKLFSFNSPVGACSDCGGLGTRRIFDPEKIVSFPSLSLSEGAIRNWEAKTPFYFQMLEELAKQLGFDLEMPWEKLSEEVKTEILYGTGKYKIAIKGSRGRRQKVFAGIIPIMEQRFNSTESIAVKQLLAQYLTHTNCNQCNGSRLSTVARNVLVGDYNLESMVSWPLDKLHRTINELELTGSAAKVAASIKHEISSRLQFLLSVGLNYLNLNRTAETLSGGEGQRIRLASQIGSGLVGVMYVLDEPSIGLHQRDNDRLLSTLTHLRDLGNTVIVVEHDYDAMLAADHIIDMGPAAGRNGGAVIAAGTAKEIAKVAESVTGRYLSGQETIAIPKARVPYDAKHVLRVINARGNNLKGVNAYFPVGLMTCVTGVSGSGKSTLVNDTLLPAAMRELNGARERNILANDGITGLSNFDFVVAIDQSPIGRTPRSNPATYTGVFTVVRELFAQTKEAKTRGYLPGRFSFNVTGGRCDACQGDGVIKVSMHFLSDVYVKCDTCNGTRYQRETLSVLYKGKSIHDVLCMTIDEALEFFSAIPALKKKLTTLQDVGLGYIQLGQSATTLSGGEAQRIKLSKELAKRSTGRTLYIMDEPTTGLHFFDVKQLLTVCHRLRDQGNTLIIIEHHLDVIKTADWVIDLGPEGGDAGGEIVAKGTPEDISKDSKSATGKFLVTYLP